MSAIKVTGGKKHIEYALNYEETYMNTKVTSNHSWKLGVLQTKEVLKVIIYREMSDIFLLFNFLYFSTTSSIIRRTNSNF